MMRLFVALEVPAAIREEIARRLRPLRAELPAARWVRPDGMHLTLAFLGEVDPVRLEPLGRALAPAVAAGRPLELALGAIGAFPPRGRRRVVWIGVETAGDLAGLQNRVASAARVRERRPYHPHLTLARCKPPWPSSAVDKLAASFDAPPAGWRADHGTLFESELHPSGARYRAVGTYPLGDAAS